MPTLDPNLDDFLTWLKDYAESYGSFAPQNGSKGRTLAHHEEFDFDASGLSEFLSRDNLQQDWVAATQPDSENTINQHEAMSITAQHDYLAAVHRDMSLRYSSRVRRVGHEIARRKGQSNPRGLVESILRQGFTNLLSKAPRGDDNE